MTETLTEPQAPPEDSTPAPALPEADQSKASVKKVEHTPGGFPVVPLSLSGTNATAGLLATAALTGGPVAAAVAMTGAAVLGTAAACRRKNGKKKTGAKPTAAAAKTLGKGGGRGLLGRVPAQPRTSPRGGKAGSGKAGDGQARNRAGRPTNGRSGTSNSQTGKPSARQRAANAVGSVAGGRAGQVGALRSQTRAQSPTRAAARTAAAQARRQVADTRRAARAEERAASGSNVRGRAARTLGKTLGRAAAARDKAITAARTARDRSADRAVDRARQGVRSAAHRQRVAQLKAPAQKAARKALLRSAARFHARKALAAVFGGVAGLAGLITTPLGRKLGWGWLMHPGRRLYRFLVGRAEAEREARDEAIRAQLDKDEQAAEEQAAAEQDQNSEQQIGARVQRPTAHVPAPPTSQGAHAVSNVSGFRFEELAAEMEQAAQSYEPENCMEILAMLEGLPEALQAIANILKILAERSDSEFPLEKVVADMLSDLYSVFVNSVSSSEDLGSTFRQAHEADIARFEDPRNGPEAEKGWNV
ncbi:hypothetical protein [Streptomyces sp. NBC_01565]|uniref:hypothetical protein n=1 Tax=unclassified Streptomyces TaxID=2593676 RepID=UPI00225942DD|nr:hypothetical protein [Streptomyces sp. NBC_01565]MCX4541908.1 hypothetical protein [Streptomyces sp. NBC_01565]